MSNQLTLAPPQDPPKDTINQALVDVTPFCIALVPFGLAIGHASALAGFTIWQTLFGAVTLLAGSSQLAAIETIDSGGGVVLTALVVALINIRFVLYGAGVSSWFRDLPLSQRLTLVVPVVDQSFFLCQEFVETESDPRRRRTYYLTVSGALVTTFVLCQLIAHRLGTTVPDELGLEMAAPLAFAGMLAKSVADTPTAVAASAAAIGLVAGSTLLGTLALPVAVFAGVAAAVRSSR